MYIYIYIFIIHIYISYIYISYIYIYVYIIHIYIYISYIYIYIYHMYIYIYIIFIYIYIYHIWQSLIYNLYPRCSMYGIFTCIWAIFVVHVGKCSIHGASGYIICVQYTLYDLSLPLSFGGLNQMLSQSHNWATIAPVDRYFPDWACHKLCGKSSIFRPKFWNVLLRRSLGSFT